MTGHPRTMEIPRRAGRRSPTAATAGEPEGLRRVDMPTTREMPSLALVPLSAPARVPRARLRRHRRPLLVLAAVLPAVVLLGWIGGGGGWW